MLRRFGLPLDTAPDDTESPAFQSYGQRVSVLNLLNLRQVMMIGAVLIALVLMGLGVWVLLPEAGPEYRVVPNPNVFPAPTDDPVAVLPNSVPQTVTEQVGITIPARIDESLSAGSSRLYAFRADAGVAWRVIVVTDGVLQPSVSLFDPTGALVDSAIAQFQAEFVLSAGSTGVYTLVVEDSLVTGGGYTLQILPIF